MFGLHLSRSPRVRAAQTRLGDLFEVVSAGTACAVQPEDERVLPALVVRRRNEQTVGHCLECSRLKTIDRLLRSQ
jgi:hypothetical protein